MSNPNLGFLPRYTKEQRRAVRAAIKEMLKENLSEASIAHRLAVNGVKTPSGGVPTEKFVINQLRYITKRRKRRSQGEQTAHTSTAPTGAGLPPLVASILTDPTLSDRQRLRMIEAFGNVVA